MGFQTTKTHPNSNGISFNPSPTELKFTHFKKPKVFEIIGKGGKDSNPIPPKNA